MASRSEVHVGDIGTVFIVTIIEDDDIVDISSATVMKYCFKAADGDTIEKTNPTVDFYTDGTDGKLKYVGEDIFDIAGTWQLQAMVTTPSGTWYSSVDRFTVEDNIFPAS